MVKVEWSDPPDDDDDGRILIDDICKPGDLVRLTATGDRIKTLEKLATIVARNVELCKPHLVSPLSTQLRQIMAEIEQLKLADEDDETGYPPSIVDTPKELTIEDVLKRRRGSRNIPA